MADKLVITSTEMFDSMEVGAKPTRAEISMVSNAVLDGADYIMLSCETSKSKNAVEAINMLSKCCIEAEKLMDFRVDHLRDTSVADLTEETYDYLVQESKDKGIDKNNDWLPKTLLTLSGQCPKDEITNAKLAVSVFDTFSRVVTLENIIRHIL